MANVYVQHFGPADAPALVLLHGWASNGEVWKGIIERLESHFALTVIDVPSLGRSVGYDVLTSQQAVDLIAEQAPEQALWVAWSLGGQLAIDLATRHPSKVTSLCLVASNPCFVEREDWSSAMTQAVFDQFTQMLSTRPSKTLQRFQRLQTLGSSQAADEMSFLAAVSAFDSDVDYNTALAWLSEDQRPAFAKLTCPVSLVLGEGDAVVPASLAEAAKDLLPSANVRVLADAGHLPFMSYPDVLVDEISSLAARVHQGDSSD